MKERMIALIGLSIFAIVLAIVIGTQLTGGALLIAFGIALGIILGIPVGAMAVLVGRRKGPTGQPWSAEEGSTMLTLTEEQAERLFKAIDRPQQASADGFTLPSRQGRQFSAVGGADLSDSADDTP